MTRQTQRLGGFVALNTGRIIDCYCKVKLRGTDHTVHGGFCGENRGSLTRCFTRGRVFGGTKSGGFVAKQNGDIEHCFWPSWEGIDPSDWWDWERSLKREDIHRRQLENWDFDATWYSDAESGAEGIGLYDRPPMEREHDRVVEISDQKGLLTFAQEVNSGEGQAGTLYRLVADINLKGKSWVPIGIDQETAFQGCFDGRRPLD